MDRRKPQTKIHRRIVSEQGTIRTKAMALVVRLTFPLVEEVQSEYAILASIEPQ